MEDVIRCVFQGSIHCTVGHLLAIDLKSDVNINQHKNLITYTRSEIWGTIMTTIYQQQVSSHRKCQCAEWEILARALMWDLNISGTSTNDYISGGHYAVTTPSKRAHNKPFWSDYPQWYTCSYHNKVYVTSKYMQCLAPSRKFQISKHQLQGKQIEINNK